jgi:hypothetical protein
MSKRKKKPLPPYWSYVKNILREYPTLKRIIETPLDVKLTANYTGMPGGSGVSDPTANAVIHDLHPHQQRKYDAVEAAIRRTGRTHPDTAKTRLDIIRLVYFEGKYNVGGAAMQVHVHFNTATTYQADFIRMVAEELDLP